MIYHLFCDNYFIFWQKRLILSFFGAGRQAPWRGCTYTYTHKPTDQVFEVLTTRAIDNYPCSSTVQHA